MASSHDVPGIEGPDAATLERGYEARDVRAGIIWILLAGFALFFAGLCALLFMMYRHDKKQGLTGQPASVVSTTTLHGDAPPLQPEIDHESLDAWDLAKMRAQEDSTFDALGWTRDPNTHRYVVPAAIEGQLRQHYAASMPSTALTASTRPTGGVQ